MSDSIDHLIRSDIRNRDKEVKSLSQLTTLINDEIDAKEKAISSQRIKLKTSRGVWKPNERVVRLMINKNINPMIGSTVNSIKYLNPLEALFLVESQCLEVLREDIPLSVEECFDLFLSDEKQFNVYQVYSYLSRSGHIVKYHQNSAKTGRKRKLSETENQFEANYYELSSFVANYKSVVNIRQLSLNHQVFSQLINKTFGHSVDKPIADSIHNSVMYEIEDKDIPLELNPMLTLFKGNVKPLCDLGSVLSSSQLYDLMQISGPKQKKRVNPRPTQNNSILDVFNVSTKRVDKTPKFNVIVTNTEDEVPNGDNIIALEEECNSQQLCFAVIDSNDFVLCSVSRLHLNPEYPLLWEQYLKSYLNIETLRSD